MLPVVNEIESSELLGLLITYQNGAFVEMFSFATLKMVYSSFRDAIPSKVD